MSALLDVSSIANLHTYGLYDGDDGLDALRAVWEAERIIKRTGNIARERERCRRSFPYFLRYVQIPDVHSGKLIRFQLWPHILTIARDWQTGESWIEGKARQMGYTWMLAIYDVWKATFHPYTNILSFSIGQKESTALGKRVMFVNDNLPEWLKEPITGRSTKAIEWGGTNSLIQTLASTGTSGRGETATLVQTDEWAFHENASEHYSAYRAALADGGQHLGISTGNGTNNVFANFFRQTSNRVPYNRRFLGWSTRPGRTKEWYDRERFAYMAASMEADFDDEEFGRHPKLFQRENPVDIAEMFMVFVGLVYDLFDSDTHVTPAPFEWAHSRFRVAGVDPGQGDPAAINVIGENSYQHAHVFGEKHWDTPVGEDEITMYLMQWHQQAPFDGIAVDGNEGTLISTLQARGLPAFPANKERPTGIGHMYGRLLAPNLSFSPELRYTLRDITEYMWSTTTASGLTNRWQTSTPVDHHADHMDDIRYALMLLAQIKSRAGVLPAAGAQPSVGRIAELLQRGPRSVKLKRVREGGVVGYRDPGVKRGGRSSVRRGPVYTGRGMGNLSGLGRRR